MKIEIKERGSKDYYDEFLYIAFRYKDFLRKPKRKAYHVTKFLLLTMVFALISIIFSIIVYLNTNDILYIVLTTLLLFILGISLCYYVIMKKQINTFLSDNSVKEININTDGIEYKDNRKSMSLAWNNVSSIIINKYSICFLSNEGRILISIDKKYQEKVIKGLKNYHKEILLIDNSFLYKES